MRSKLTLCVVLALAATAFAKDPKAYLTGAIVQMDSVSCGTAEKDSQSLAGEMLGTNSGHKKTQEVLLMGTGGMPGILGILEEGYESSAETYREYAAQVRTYGRLLRSSDCATACAALVDGSKGVPLAASGERLDHFAVQRAFVYQPRVDAV